MQRIASVVFAIVLGLLFGLGIWFRVASPGSMPSTDADEAWYAVQAHNAIAGKHFEAFTPYWNPLNPFFASLHVPALLTGKPALWHLRVPPALCGILAVLGTYVLGRRVLDRTTALIASALLAVLPIAILFSRHAYDVSQTPLFLLLALYFAFRAHRLGTALAFLASYIVHPTNIFALPVVLLVFLVQELKKTPGDRLRRWRVALVTMTVPVAFALLAGVVTLRRPQLQAMFQKGGPQKLGHHDVLVTLTMWRRLFLGVATDPSMASSASRWNDGLFWIPLLGFVALGTRRLVLDRQWDRVALVAGVFASAGGFFVVAGSDAIPPFWAAFLRYGLFLVVPTALGLACVARGVLIEPTTAPRALARQVQHAGLLALGVALLLGARSNLFDPYTRTGMESLWTLRPRVRSQFEQAFTEIRHDIRRELPGAGMKSIITEDYWVQKPMEYLASSRADIQLVEYPYFKEMYPGHHREGLREALRWGAYVVSYAGRDLERDVTSAFPAERLRRWDLDTKDGPPITVYRLRREQPRVEPATRDVARSPGGTSRR